MFISDDEFSRLFNDFQQEAFRLETLSVYAIPNERDNFAAFLAGKPQPEKHKNSSWVATIKGNVQAGKRMYRVHVLARPLTDYLRYELSWGYHRNQAAGEEFFILDVTDKPNPLEGVQDFWLFDSTTPVSMHYNADGHFLGGKREADTTEWLGWRELALSQAEPFNQWWQRHAGERSSPERA